MCEMSLSSYTATLFSEDPAFIAIPVFPSRLMRHSCIFINKNSGIDSPKDLVGKRVGTPEWQMTATVWERGLLQDDYGVPIDSVKYFSGGVENPGRVEKIPIDLAPNISLTPIPADKTLSQMLEDGEIDALYHAGTPPIYYTGKNVKRLFENYTEVEQEYFKRTRIFHIMHTFVIRRDLYERHPWIAQSMLKALTEAKNKACELMNNTGGLKYTLPWLIDHIEKTRELMGDDYWPYGLEPNRHVLETFLRYSFEQSLSKRLLKPEELFAPESLETWKL
jgi:4,5-dihydroxyphthalate decarboxylase